ncbi:MAG: DUF2723 domain-containing protein [Bacteroidales bacterium]|nr:DUF2723 domain-containing protein [Bacteroidales bacterium]
MGNFKKLNNLIAWIVFAIATLVYFLTLEPTASWWDCGEYIATAYKLQVGHPPGAPFFQLLGRFFTLFAFGDTSKVALMINSMSALSSSFTILFLFWTITHFARKIATDNSEMTEGKKYAILGSGIVGALAYTFSDSFWFSAAEGEVYAMSSFFTAIVFWAILKWEEQADEKHSYRWIILIAYLIGLSIGVHLLNLVAIPAITFVYYFKKYKPTNKGIFKTLIISFLILAFVMFIIIPWIVMLASKFELLFVNSFGLPFNSGAIVYFIIIIGGIIWGLRYTVRKQKVILNTIILGFTFILIGYSTFFLLLIRSNANTPIDENNPEEAISLLSYLNREQYGDWPLVHEQYYNAPLDSKDPYIDGNPIYIKDKQAGKYVMTNDRKESLPNYDPRFETIFPRMWSSQKSIHKSAYKSWGGDKGIPISVSKPDGTTEVIYKPTFGENLKYFFSYQVGHMYFRYFMWNFAGRQNDIQGHGNITDGNWISGIPFLDEMRLGPQDTLPNNKINNATNKFYLLPFILGLIGLFFHMNRNKRDTFIVALLFFMTGLAIIIYLNQYPYQPRERDYAFAASFYAFAIWIGLGVFAIADALSKKLNPKLSSILIILITLILVPANMAQQGWDDHNRSGKYAARDFAANYLNSCAPNAILVTNGDNDTFPLWYVQEVEGIRTDVRVVNFMLASGAWYIHQLSRKVYDSDPLPLTLRPDQYNNGINMYIPFYERRKIKGYTDLKELIDFVASDNEQTKLPLQSGKKINYFPTKKVRLYVDSATVVGNGTVPKDKADKIVPYIEWEIKKNYIYKNDLMMLDFIASNNWERPVYFANPSSVADFMNIDKYVHAEGIVYRLMPYPAEHYLSQMGGVNVDKSYDILLNECKWGNLEDPDVTVDRESYRDARIPKNNYIRLAQALLDKNKLDSASKVSDKFIEFFPDNKVKFDFYMLPFAEVYYRGGEIEKANAIIEQLLKNNYAELVYYNSLDNNRARDFAQQKQQAIMVLQRLSEIAQFNQQAELQKKIDDALKIWIPPVN